MRALLPTLATVMAMAMASGAQAQDQLLDDFADPAAWTLSASDDVKAALRPAAGPNGSALVHRLRLRQGHRLRERPTGVADRLSRALRVHAERARRCAAQRAAVQARRRGPATTCGGRTGPTFDFRTTGRRTGFARETLPSPGAHGRSPASPQRLGRARDRLGSGAGKGSVCFDQLVLRRLPDTRSPDEPREFDA
jgi:hypothetical protein